MIIYFYLFIPLLFATTESSSIRGSNNKNDLVPFTSSRSDPEKKDSSVKTVGSEPLFMQLLPNSGNMETGGKDKKKKRRAKKRVSKIKALRKRQRTRRELQVTRPKSTEEEFSGPLETLKTVNAEKLENLTNAINRADALKALSTYSKKADNKRSDVEDLSSAEGRKNDHEIGKHTAMNRNHLRHILAEQMPPLVKMAYPNTPKFDRHPHKAYTYRDLITDRERLEQKINYIKNMFSLNDSIIDDAIRVRRRSDSDRIANKMAKMFLTLSAVNGLHDRRKSKDDDDDDDENRIWEKERKDRPSRRSSSSNAERYKVKKWIEFMKNKRSSAKTCPCMASYGEERDVFPLEQKMPKDYFLMERRGSSEESDETYKDPSYTSRDKTNRENYSRDKPNRENYSRRRLNKSQEDQDSKLKGNPKIVRKKSDTAFSDLEVYRSRAQQILRNAEEILDRIKEEEEKRLAAPDFFMNQLKELTSRIQNDPRHTENELIQKLQKNLGWGPLARPEEGADGNKFADNGKSLVMDPYERAKALREENKKLTSYLLWNLGKLQEASKERTEGKEAEGDGGKENIRVYFGRVSPEENEKPLPDNLAKGESEAGPRDIDESEIYKEESYKQKVDDIIKQQQKILDEYKMINDTEESRQEMERVGDGEEETVRETQSSNSDDNAALQLKEHDTDRNTESTEKAIKSGDKLAKAWSDNTKDKPFVQPERTSWGQKGGTEGTSSGSVRPEENVQEKIEEFTMTINEGNKAFPGDEENMEEQQFDQKEDFTAQTGEELIQAKHDREGANEWEEMEVVAPPQKTLGKISERDENDVASSPHLTHNYDLLNAREIKDGSSRPVEENPTANDYFILTVEEDPSQIKSDDDIVVETKENLETEKSEESGLNPSKEVSVLGNKETMGLQKSALENSMVSKSYTEEKQESNKMAHGAKQHPEYADLIKQVGRGSAEASKIITTPEESQEKEMTDRNEELQEPSETLEIIHVEDSDELTPERGDRAQKGEQTLLKLAADLPQDSEVLEEKNDQDYPNGNMLKENLPENSEHETVEELQPTFDNLYQQSIKDNDDTSLKMENPETLGEESSEEALLEEAFKQGARDEQGGEVPLRAEKPAEERYKQEMAISADESNNDRVLLKEAKENSEGIPMLTVVDNDQETDSGEESFEKNNNSNEENKTFEEESDGAQLKAVRDEDLEEDVETVASPNEEDGGDSENLQEMNAKASMENEEETLETEHVADDASNQGNQDEMEISQEIIGKEMPEERRSEENTKLEEYIGHENDGGEISESLNKDQNNLEEGTDFKPTSNESEDDDADREATLRAENSQLKTEDDNEEISRGAKTSSGQENLEEKNDETVLEKENSENKIKEEQNSSETLKAALESESQDTVENVEDDETIKAVNPVEGIQKLEEQYSNEDGDDESVKEVFEGNEENDGNQETVRAETGDAEDTLDDEAVKAENVEGEVQEERNSNEENGESVKAAFVNENQENLESDDIAREALENSENIYDEEAALKKAKNDEELKRDENVEERADNEDEELKENKATETQENDYIPLRASLSEENLEEEDEALQAENRHRQETQKESMNDNESQLRSVSMEDELDNKIDDESTLRSSNPMVETNDQDFSSSLNEEILREESSSNEVHQKEGENLKSENFDVHQSGKSYNENSQEMFAEDILGENAVENNDSGERDVNLRAEVQESGRQLSDMLQVPEPSSKSLKSSALKVPKSIAEIMNDLEGKTKGDISSLQKLNPDKIDHIIGKIDQAEQKHLLENQETDCVKECACAEEMNTRSRNIGRYEIVKDFLHWMKDLQLNRVLSDD